MKIHFIISIAITFVFINSSSVYSQENNTDSAKIILKPVKHTFEHAVLINNQTVENIKKSTLDFIIQHRFGIIENVDDMIGIYGPSNIRIGLDYGITKRISVGIGATKNKHYYDLEWKYILMQQMTGRGFPVTISYYGNLARSADDKDKFINREGAYKSSDRFSYFHEIMFARKINTHISLQLAGTYSHFNIVDSAMVEHNFYGASFLGRYKLTDQTSVQFEFDYPLNVSNIDENVRPKPNLGIGIEMSTSSHQFQVFVCTANGIINQEARVFNQNDFTKREIMIGFNITRQWGF